MKTIIKSKFPLLNLSKSSDTKLVFDKGFANTLYFAKKKAFLIAEIIFTKTKQKEKISIELYTDENEELIKIEIDKLQFDNLPKVNVFNIKQVVNQFYNDFKI